MKASSKAMHKHFVGAYTLTEMLVVLVIVGLLAAIVGPRLFSRLDDAKTRTARLQISSLMSAVDLFRLDVGRLPTQDEGLDALVASPADGASAWLGPYLARGTLPRDPWGRAYNYELDEANARFRVVSYGADGRPSGVGASADIIVESDAASAPTNAAAVNAPQAMELQINPPPIGGVADEREPALP
jgi:general secretion pathway protein G